MSRGVDFALSSRRSRAEWSSCRQKLPCEDAQFCLYYCYILIQYAKCILFCGVFFFFIPAQSLQPSTLGVKRQRRAQKVPKRLTQEEIRPGTPEPVKGREHVYVQTELYLEEISDRIIEIDGECQTDEFLDRPPTPLFIPAKTGKDVATQIEEGELFDFDIEVKPILEVLVGKTVEQALLEVMEEEELAQLLSHQRAFAELRNAEFAELQRLEEQDRRIREEKERRRLEHLEKLRKQKETAEKIAARAFAQRYLADLIPSVFNNLHESGFFYDPVERDIETVFLPWLMSEVEETLQKKVLGRTMLDCKLPNPGMTCHFRKRFCLFVFVLGLVFFYYINMF
uniref:Radial spoke head 3 n=1 Tax=Zosterops lateralis melanops TaxID=1220523 RepID=A0A8D2NSY8_ZOSLA